MMINSISSQLNNNISNRPSFGSVVFVRAVSRNYEKNGKAYYDLLNSIEILKSASMQLTRNINKQPKSERNLYTAILSTLRKNGVIKLKEPITQSTNIGISGVFNGVRNPNYFIRALATDEDAQRLGNFAYEHHLDSSNRPDIINFLKRAPDVTIDGLGKVGLDLIVETVKGKRKLVGIKFVPFEQFKIRKLANDYGASIDVLVDSAPKAAKKSSKKPLKPKQESQNSSSVPSQKTENSPKIVEKLKQGIFAFMM